MSLSEVFVAAVASSAIGAIECANCLELGNRYSLSDSDPEWIVQDAWDEGWRAGRHGELLCPVCVQREGLA